MTEPLPSEFRDMMGMDVTAFMPGSASIELTPTPQMTNYLGMIHGGVIASIIDTAGTLSGCLTPNGDLRNAVTLSMSINFVGVGSGRIRAVARSRGGGRRIFYSTVELFDDQDGLVATGQGNHRYLAGPEPR